MNFSIIQKSQLEGAQRLDADYYQSEYLGVAQQLRKLKTITLGEFCRISDGDHSKIPGFVDGNGVRYLRAKDLQNFFIDNSDPVFISKDYFQRLKRSYIKPLDLVLSIMGTVGNLAIATPEYGVITANRAVSIISPRTQDLFSSYFLAAYLESKFGVAQRSRESMGGVQQRVNLDDLRNIKIPLIPNNKQQLIIELFINAVEQYENSKTLYRQAEDLLLEELGLDDFQMSEDLSYVVNYSDTEKVERVDADYFQPKYEELIAGIKKHDSKLLGELVYMKKGFEPGSEAYQDEGKLFIRVSSLSKNGVENKDQKYLSNELYQKLKSNFEPKVGEILLTKDATPGIAYVLKESVEGIISGGILRLAAKTDLDLEYLALCINSMVGQLQAERDAGGSIIVHWKPEQIRNVLIPVLPIEVQQKIADLVKKSHEARKKSKQLLEEAKGKVEEMIEKGGEENGQ